MRIWIHITALVGGGGCWVPIWHPYPNPVRHWSIITVSPRSGDPLYIVSYYIKWVTTSWTYSNMNYNVYRSWRSSSPGHAGQLHNLAICAIYAPSNFLKEKYWGVRDRRIERQRRWLFGLIVPLFESTGTVSSRIYTEKNPEAFTKIICI